MTLDVCQLGSELRRQTTNVVAGTSNAGSSSEDANRRSSWIRHLVIGPAISVALGQPAASIWPCIVSVHFNYSPAVNPIHDQASDKHPFPHTSDAVKSRRRHWRIVITINSCGAARRTEWCAKENPPEGTLAHHQLYSGKLRSRVAGYIAFGDHTASGPATAVRRCIRLRVETMGFQPDRLTSRNGSRHRNAVEND